METHSQIPKPMTDYSKLTYLGTGENGAHVYAYRHLYIRWTGDTSDPDSYEVLKTDQETVMHRSSMKGCKRYITNRKRDLDALCEEHGIDPAAALA